MTVTRDGTGSPVTRELVRALLGDVYDWPQPGPKMRLSGLGACRRQMAYQAAGVVPSDLVTQHPASKLGTWIHEGLLPLLNQAVPDSVIEQEVWWTPWPGAEPIPGHADLAAPGIVVDLKTLGQYPMERFTMHGPRQSHQWQVHTYAAALRQAGWDIDRVQIVGLDRATGEVETWEAPHSDSDLTPIIDTVRAVVAWAESYPDSAPRDERGPGLSYLCDHCPFLTRCWGDGAVAGQTGPQAANGDVTAIEAALELYRKSLDTEADAKRDKEFARAILTGSPAGTYGRYRLSWQRPRRPRVDATAAAQMLRLLGEEPPLGRASTDPAPVVTATRKGVDTPG